MYGRSALIRRAAIVQADDAAQAGSLGQGECPGVRRLLQRGQCRLKACTEIKIIRDLADSDDRHEIGIGCNEAQFARLIARVDRYGHRACHSDTVERSDEIHAGRKQQTDVVSGLYPHGNERPSPIPRDFVQPVIAQSPIRQHDSIALLA